MKEMTMIVKGTSTEQGIQKVEQILGQLDGVERVLIDTDDGEIKIEYNEKYISGERIAISLQQHDYHIM